MKKINKKAFTIIELVVVIAIIAVLAGVLIPTFANLVKRANISSDTQLVRNLNTALALDNKEHKTMQSALDAAEEGGFDVAKISSKISENKILWDSKNDVFCYLNNGEIEYVPNSVDDGDKLDSDSYLLWKIYGTDETIPVSDEQTYSIYLNGATYTTDENKGLVISVGLDVGNQLVEKVTYESSTNYEVTVRTTSGYFVVNAPNGVVNHYDYAERAIINEVAGDSYHEYGTVGYSELVKGHYVAENGSSVNTLLVTGTASLVKVDNNGGEIMNAYTSDEDSKEMLHGGNTSLTYYKITGESSKENLIASATMFAGGKGTEENPFLITNENHWNNFYQMAYDWNEDVIPYFELGNDIDLTNKHITNYAIDSEGNTVKDYDLCFDLNGNGYTIKGITYLDGYKQLFPYTYYTNIHDITIDYNINSNRTTAMIYSPAGYLCLTNVTTTGSLYTTANWATPYVAYANKTQNNDCKIYYTNCVNYATVRGSYGSNGYIAVFGSHNGGGGHITFDNCKNYGSLFGGNVGFVGMGNESAYTFVDSNAVKNYGSLIATQSAGYFYYNKSDETVTIDGVTCDIKQSSAQIRKSTTHTDSVPENYGEQIVLNAVDGATVYEVEMSFNLQVYNYDNDGNANKWSGGFPQSLILTYNDSDVVNNKITTELRKCYLGEFKASKYFDYQNKTEVSYNGIFIPDTINLESEGVNVILQSGNIYLLEYNEKYFYATPATNNLGWYGLLCTDNSGNVTTTSITITYTVTAYNPNGSVLSFSNFEYVMSVEEAKNFFNSIN